MARRSNTAERRAQIVAALGRVMAERGYDGASVAAIAEAAGLTPGLVHYHFRSKQEILLALLEHLAATVRARVERAGGDTPRERLGRLVDAFLALDAAADAGAVACWVTLGAEALRQEEVRRLYAGATAESVEALEAAVRAVLADEGRSTREARAIAAGALAAIQGYMVTSVAVPGAVPRGSAARTLRAMVLGAVEAQPGKAWAR